MAHLTETRVQKSQQADDEENVKIEVQRRLNDGAIMCCYEDEGTNWVIYSVTRT